MPSRPHRVPPEGAFIIVQQRGHDRVLFEIDAGTMVSIRVEPNPDQAIDSDNPQEAALALMATKGSC